MKKKGKRRRKMSCFPCFWYRGKATRRTKSDRRELSVSLHSRSLKQQHHHHHAPLPPPPPRSTPAENPKGNQVQKEAEKDIEIGEKNNIQAQTFTFRELATATKNFRRECLIGEGGFGRVYKGKLDKTNLVIAVKQLDRNGMQGNKEFLVEVLMLSLLHHQNLVNLIGYCADGDQRLLVYEYMPLGSLEDHLLDVPADTKALDWATRLKVALGAAKGLEYLHDKANPPVIYRDLKASNILLDNDFNAKLSDFGLAKLGPVGDNSHVSSRIMGTYGYCAPEYQKTGQLTLKSDVYSFGVVLLELITGQRVIDNARPVKQQNLVAWVSRNCYGIPNIQGTSEIQGAGRSSSRGRFPSEGFEPSSRGSRHVPARGGSGTPVDQRRRDGSQLLGRRSHAIIAIVVWRCPLTT